MAEEEGKVEGEESAKGEMEESTTAEGAEQEAAAASQEPSDGQQQVCVCGSALRKVQDQRVLARRFGNHVLPATSQRTNSPVARASCH
jgi:hypothetical protein